MIKNIRSFTPAHSINYKISFFTDNISIILSSGSRNYHMGPQSNMLIKLFLWENSFWSHFWKKILQKVKINKNRELICWEYSFLSLQIIAYNRLCYCAIWHTDAIWHTVMCQIAWVISFFWLTNRSGVSHRCGKKINAAMWHTNAFWHTGMSHCISDILCF